MGLIHSVIPAVSRAQTRPSDKETLSLERQQRPSPELLVSLFHSRVSPRPLSFPPFFSPPSIHFFLICLAIYMSSLARAECGGLGMERSPRERRRRQVEARVCVRARERARVCLTRQPPLHTGPIVPGYPRYNTFILRAIHFSFAGHSHSHAARDTSN